MQTDGPTTASPIFERRCGWSEFHRTIDEIKMGIPRDEASILFRGQSNSEWPLSTSLERATNFRKDMTLQRYYSIAERQIKEVQSVTGKRWGWQECQQESNGTILHVANLEYLTYLRHHGFPSPLLDWSRSPYVAAFFAFCDAVAGSGGWVAVYVLVNWRRSIGWAGAPVIWRTGDYLTTDDRHYRQQSDYTIAYRGGYRSVDGALARDLLLPHEDVAEASVSIPQHGNDLYKVMMPAADRSKALTYFMEHNINRHTLYGDEDSFVKSLGDVEFLEP